MDNKLKILITNDDGIDSPGLLRLAKAALAYGEVWVVAPSSQRSAASHSLTIDKPLDVFPVDFGIEGIHAFSCSGLPSDCVRIGYKNIMPSPPDIVFSGINNGFNAGTDIQYSATVGAALDAAVSGFPVIAFSEGFLIDPYGVSHGRKVTDIYLPQILKILLGPDAGNDSAGSDLHAVTTATDMYAGAAGPDSQDATSTDMYAGAAGPDIPVVTPGQVININFPDCAPEDCKGILWNCKIAMSTPFIDNYAVSEELPGGGKRYSIRWVDRDHADEGTDLRALLDNYVAVGIVNNIS